METLKNAVGLGDANTTTANNETKGQEPVSGVTGAGTADQPYDSGNVEDSHLAGESANSTSELQNKLRRTSSGFKKLTSSCIAADDQDVAAPLKALAPGGGILSTLASAVGLQSSTTSNNATVTEQQGQEPVSGMTGEGTADQPYDAGNSEDSTLGGQAAQHTGAAPGISGVEQSSATAREQDPATTNQGLQFVGISSAADTQSSYGAGTQQHSSIKEAVAEGALGGKEDPAQSNKGLAFVSKYPNYP